MKKFLRELPTPLTTYELYNDFLSVATLTEPDEIIEKLQSLISQLPLHNRYLLNEVMSLLDKVVQHSDINLMNAGALSTVIGVNLLKSKDPNPLVMLKDVKNVNKCCELMIQFYNKLDIVEDNKELEEYKKKLKEIEKAEAELEKLRLVASHYDEIQILSEHKDLYTQLLEVRNILLQFIY